MSKEEAERVLQCWLKCPYAFGDGYCKLEDEQYCGNECWSREKVKEAVQLFLVGEHKHLERAVWLCMDGIGIVVSAFFIYVFFAKKEELFLIAFCLQWIFFVVYKFARITNK